MRFIRENRNFLLIFMIGMTVGALFTLGLAIRAMHYQHQLETQPCSFTQRDMR